MSIIDFVFRILNYTNLAIMMFYIIAPIVFLILFYYKTNKLAYSLVISSLIVLVGTEYWEIPVFFCSWFGLLGHVFYMPSFVNNILILWAFIILVVFSEVKFSKLKVFFLVAVPFINAPLLLTEYALVLIHPHFIGRIIALTVLGGIFYFGNPLVRI